MQFDAPIGYPSITANYTSEWKRWWFDHENVRLFQFMGKDNVYFHTIFFPSIQIGDGRPWTMLHHLSTTGEFYDATSFHFRSTHANQNILTMRAGSSQKAITVECLALQREKLVYLSLSGDTTLFPPDRRQLMPCSRGPIV